MFNCNTSCRISDQNSPVVSLVFGLAIFFVMGLNETVWSPFLPTIFDQYGISELTTGIVVATYEVAYLTASIFFLTVNNVNNQLFKFCANSALAGIFIAFFGQLIKINSVTVFIALSIAVRGVIGFAVGIYFCSGTSLLFSMFPDDAGKFFSYVSVSVSLGFISGTPFGSFFYGIGGYDLPFIASGSLQLFLSAATYYVLPSSSTGSVDSALIYPKQSLDGDNSETTSSSQLLNKKSVKNELSVLELLTNRGVIVLSAAVIATITSVGFVFVSFGPLLLAQFGITQEHQGLYFLPFTVSRAVSAPVFGHFTDRGFAGLIFTLFGCFLSSMSLVLLALPGYFNLLRSLVYLEIVIALTGIGSAGALVPFIALLQKDYERRGNEFGEKFTSYMSALYCLCYGLGVIIGEVITGGIFRQKLGFYNSCVVQSLLCAVAGCISTLFLVEIKLLLPPGHRSYDSLWFCNRSHGSNSNG